MASCFCCAVNWRLDLVGLVIDGQSEGHGVTPNDLSTKPGQPHRVRSVEKERDEARSQVQNLRKERLLERLFSEAEGRVGGDERGTFFDTFVTLCGGHFQLGDVDGRERLLPVDGKGQPLTADGVALCDGDYMEELRRHPVFSFLFQQRSGLYAGTVAEAGHDHSAAPNLQTLSTAELYLEAVKATTPRAAAPRR